MTCTAGYAAEVIVFAVNSQTETLTELGGKYMAVHPDKEILFISDSSGTLKPQIQEGQSFPVSRSGADEYAGKTKNDSKPED